MTIAERGSDKVMNDLKLAIRQIGRRPGGTVVILGTLGLVVGAMALVLGIISHETAAYMPFPEPDEVVTIWQVSDNGTQDKLPVRAMVETLSHVKGLEAAGGVGFYGSQVLTGVGEPKSLSVLSISPEIFHVTGRLPHLGRFFTADDVNDGETQLAVLSHEIWTSTFDQDEAILGREITLNRTPYTVIGVMPEGMDYNGVFYGNDLWIPKDIRDEALGDTYMKFVGRRRDGVSPEQLDAELNAVVLPAVQEFVAGRTHIQRLTAQRADRRPGQRIDEEHVLGFAIPLLILGVAGFNVANVLLGRMLMRRHEFAVRFSLGARRWRLVRQLLTESAVLALLAGMFGLLAAYWTARWAAQFGMSADFNGKVILGTTLFAGFVGLVVGWLPALRATRGDFLVDLKDSAAAVAGGGRQRHRLRNLLVVGQVGMATALCVAAGLLIRSQMEKRRFDPGFDSERLLQLSVELNGDLYPEPADRILYRESVMERLRAVPGVETVSYSSDRTVERFPFTTSFYYDGQLDWQRDQRAEITMIGPEYLELIEVPVLKGRGLEASDRDGAPPVMLVNQSFAQQFFPEEDAVGETVGLSLDGKKVWPMIVGVIPDRPNVGRRQDLGPEMYLSAAQFAPRWTSTFFLIRAAAAPAGLYEPLLQAAKGVDANLPVNRPRTLATLIERAQSRDVVSLRLFTGIGLFGLLIASLGIYGVVGYSVTERRREIGIRMALGASRDGVLRLVLRQGLGYAGIGLVVGLVLASILTIGLREVVYGVSPFDPVTFFTVGLVLTVASLGATLFPAVRAMRIDPVHSLRYE